MHKTATVTLVMACVMAVTAGCTSPPRPAALSSPQSPPPTPATGAAATPPLEIESAPFELIAEDSAPIPYRTDEAHCRLFTDPGDAPDLSALVSRAAAARLDIDRYVYVAVFHGRKPTTQHYLVLEEVAFDRGLVVLALRLNDDGPPGEKETWPYIVVAIARTPQIQGDTTFVVNVDGDELCRMAHRIAPPPGG